MATKEKARNAYMWDIDKNINYLFNIEKGDTSGIHEKLADLSSTIPEAQKIIRMANALILLEVTENWYGPITEQILSEYTSRYKTGIKKNRLVINKLEESFEEVVKFTDSSSVLSALIKNHLSTVNIIVPLLKNTAVLTSRLPIEYDKYREKIELYFKLLRYRVKRGTHLEHLHNGIQAYGTIRRGRNEYLRRVESEYNAYNSYHEDNEAIARKKFLTQSYHNSRVIPYYSLSSLFTKSSEYTGLREISLGGIHFITNDIKFELLRKVIAPTLIACTVYGLEHSMQRLRNRHTNMEIIDDSLLLRGFLDNKLSEPLMIHEIITTLCSTRVYSPSSNTYHLKEKDLIQKIKGVEGDPVVKKDLLKAYPEGDLLDRVLAASLAFPCT